MSSYIVTTKRPRTRQAWPDKPSYALSRRAVATLEEARRTCLGVLDAAHLQGSPLAVYRAAVDLPESGGTVGPLPDGTRIEVEQRKRSALYRELPTIVQARFGSWANMTDEQACSAWNANYAREAAA